MITRYHQIRTIIYCKQNFIYVNVFMCVCVCVCMYMCVRMLVCVNIYVYIFVHYYKDLRQNIINWHFKQLIVNDFWLHNHQQSKTKTNKQTNNQNHSSRWWNLISSSGEPQQKSLYWNPKTVFLAINWWALLLNSL